MLPTALLRTANCLVSRTIWGYNISRLFWKLELGPFKLLSRPRSWRWRLPLVWRTSPACPGLCWSSSAHMCPWRTFPSSYMCWTSWTWARQRNDPQKSWTEQVLPVECELNCLILNHTWQAELRWNVARALTHIWTWHFIGSVLVINDHSTIFIFNNIITCKYLLWLGVGFPFYSVYFSLTSWPNLIQNSSLLDAEGDELLDVF